MTTDPISADADLVWSLVRSGGGKAVAALSRVSQQIAREAVIEELAQLADAIESEARTGNSGSLTYVSRAATMQAVADANRLRARVTALRTGPDGGRPSTER
jgi:hypothetical protein